jgi:hypothetical protein
MNDYKTSLVHYYHGIYQACLLEPNKALVFTPLSSPAPKEDSARLSLCAPSEPGLSEHGSITLIVESENEGGANHFDGMWPMKQLL